MGKHEAKPHYTPTYILCRVSISLGGPNIGTAVTIASQAAANCGGRGNGSASWGWGGVACACVLRGDCCIRAVRMRRCYYVMLTWHHELSAFSDILPIVVCGSASSTWLGFSPVSSSPPDPDPLLTTVYRRWGDVRVAAVFRTASIHARPHV